VSPNWTGTCENRYLLPIDTGRGICPNWPLRRAAEVDSRLRHAYPERGTSQITAKHRHNVSHQGLEFSNALFDPGAS
jgi:hypothetical protein